MKYLEVSSLSRLTGLLTECEVGDVVLNGRVECFSCKAVGVDKKVAREVESHYKLEEDDAASGATSPLGPISEMSTRRLLVNLIGTLSLAFPDYDFSTLKPEDFLKLRSHVDAVSAVNSKMAPVEDVIGAGFLNAMWADVDAVIDLAESEVYSYIPDVDDDPLTPDGGLWSYNFFFFNKTKKQILYITCVAAYKESDEVGDGDPEGSPTQFDASQADDDTMGDEMAGDDGEGGAMGGAVLAAVAQGERDGPDVEDGALGWEDGI
mmetsp:Transcript_6371/g.22735  ORF Transcript_6371/g.22735 Transcript_6371/m.22735 type:complete len:264 (-) Transcript_6371:162-953(-)|eukprot:CAMPEP_0203815846 /NCGR_PEP_ID=MMETSP0115-20131106/12716_1 /ASSEMBLY_ACC=CAM_ASM_000227 /TAXON_ID=33651 /ORGANISM="Bicosoecid sp, Strain ms1" /LENGTH=263 /DNA_ID=CAMNT_0050724745 /DNA_START=210 /DNA_END=1001 /DNA_ORIENTATION=-